MLWRAALWLARDGIGGRFVAKEEKMHAPGPFSRMSRREILKRGATVAAGMGAASAMAALPHRRVAAQGEPPSLLIGSHMDPIKQLITMYAEQTGLAAQVEEITTPDLQNKLTSAFLARRAPWDATFLTADMIASLAANGWLKSVDGFVQDSVRNGGQGQLLENGMGAALYEGQTYGVPWAMGGPILHWNKQLLSEFELDPEAPATWYDTPDSWNTLVEWATEMTGEHNGEQIYGFTDAWAGDHVLLLFGSLLQANGGRWLDDDLQPVMNSEAGVAALQFISDMLHVHKCIDPACITYTWVFDASPAYLDGKRGFFLSWPFIGGVANDPEASRIAGQSGFAPNPAMETTATVDGSEFFGIPAFTDNDEAAYGFLELVVSTEGQRVVAEGGWAGIYSDVMQEPDILEQFPFYSAIATSYEYPVDGGWSPDRTTWIQILQAEVHETLAQNKTAQAALDDAVKAIVESRG
jgi:multiple sugar transport system substrate-binding protein